MASVLIHERAGAEFAILEERRDSTISSVSNTGNISLDVEGEEIAPGEVRRVRMAREEESNWVLTASGGSWDTTVVLPLRKRFYPHQTEAAMPNIGSDVLSASVERTMERRTVAWYGVGAVCAGELVRESGPVEWADARGFGL